MNQAPNSCDEVNFEKQVFFTWKSPCKSRIYVYIPNYTKMKCKLYVLRSERNVFKPEALNP